ncbi:membrane protein [Companilactobacillus sp. RD055328]|uniref:phage holin family protein n=1 Tax=Companilactobacillus sp. RD055328 TaxID=2916634 RepID=UPI001FC8EAF4|nr:phage holin family protein [Companilactobacillus sp. RD055328]GKQ43048.1 membrane protein [Companilactobacillus sp. RD055328]
MRIISKTLIYTLLFMAINQALPQYFSMDSVMTALIASFVLVLLNLTIKPILHLISFPITFLTFGLFSFVINAIILELTSSIMHDAFRFNSFGSAILVAIILSIANSIINNYVNSHK